MKELIEKLNHTGIKFLDLVEKGIDKLPDGIGALWEAAVIRVQLTGIIKLTASSIAILVGGCFIFIAINAVKKLFKTSYNESDIFLAKSLLFGIPGVTAELIGVSLLCHVDTWLMAFYPEQYILSELMLNFIK